MYNLYHLIGVSPPSPEILFLNKSSIVHEPIYDIFHGLLKNFNNSFNCKSSI